MSGGLVKKAAAGVGILAFLGGSSLVAKAQFQNLMARDTLKEVCLGSDYNQRNTKLAAADSTEVHIDVHGYSYLPLIPRQVMPQGAYAQCYGNWPRKFEGEVIPDEHHFRKIYVQFGQGLFDFGHTVFDFEKSRDAEEIQREKDFCTAAKGACIKVKREDYLAEMAQ